MTGKDRAHSIGLPKTMFFFFAISIVGLAASDDLSTFAQVGRDYLCCEMLKKSSVKSGVKVAGRWMSCMFMTQTKKLQKERYVVA